MPVNLGADSPYFSVDVHRKIRINPLIFLNCQTKEALRGSQSPKVTCPVQPQLEEDSESTAPGVLEPVFSKKDTATDGSVVSPTRLDRLTKSNLKRAQQKSHQNDNTHQWGWIFIYRCLPYPTGAFVPITRGSQRRRDFETPTLRGAATM